MKVRPLAESLFVTLIALAGSLALFGLFMLAFRTSHGDSGGAFLRNLYSSMFFGAFGSAYSWQYTLTRAAPLILTGLCTALPARLGLIVIGGEGALVLGGLAAACTGLLLQSCWPLANQLGMAGAGMLAGGLAIALVGVLHHWRGVNATIFSLLLTYIAIGVFKYLVEGPLRDPNIPNKPSTSFIPDAARLGGMFGFDVHWGLAFGVGACLLAYVLMDHTTFGFAARMAGGNLRAAQGAGVPVGRLIVVTCFLGGAAAGLAGMVEVAAVHGNANAALIANYGFAGILVSFIARHQPLAIIPAAILFGGLGASSDVLQRRMELPDASVEVLSGTIFVMILLCETLYGRFRIFMPRDVREAAR